MRKRAMGACGDWLSAQTARRAPSTRHRAALRAAPSGTQGGTRMGAQSVPVRLLTRCDSLDVRLNPIRMRAPARARAHTHAHTHTVVSTLFRSHSPGLSCHIPAVSLVRWRVRRRVDTRRPWIQRVARGAMGWRVFAPTRPTAPAVARIPRALCR